MWADALPNLLIGLREGLEAGLVVSILLAAVRRSGTGATTGAIWLGLTAAVVLALSFGAVLTFYRSILPTSGQEALGGTLSVIAVVLVTGMIFWMRRTARSLSGELKARVADALKISSAALALTAFLAVGREGVETALFLWTTAQASGQTIAPLIGAAIGIAAAVGLCVLLYRSAVRIRLDLFFNRTAILLIIIAAGVFAYGLGDLQDAGLLPGHTWVAFDLSQHIDPGSWWVTIITGVTELSPTMTWLQVVAYVCYLGVVLAVFLAARNAPAPAPRPVPEPAGTEPVAAGPRRHRMLVPGLIAALVVPPLVAGLLIGFAPGKSSGGQQINVTASSCAAGWSGGDSGTQTFTVVNKSGHPAEINLVSAASQGIVAEIETLGPATQQTLTATLGDGDYLWRCLISGLPTTTSASVHVSGSGADPAAAPLAVKPVSAADLRPALDKYDAFVEGQLTQLTGQVAQLRADLVAGQIPAAQRDWPAAQLTWETVGAAYGSFGDFGDAIDGLPDGFPQGVHDPTFTGLRRLEYGLWHGQQAGELIPIVDKLTGDINDLKAQLPQITLDPTDLPTRAHEILEDALRDRLTGDTDQGAGTGFPEVIADVQATRVVLGELAPLIDERDPKLLPKVYPQLDTLTAALRSTEVDGRWPSVASAPLAVRQKVDAAIGAVLQTLDEVPNLLEVPAH